LNSLIILFFDKVDIDTALKLVEPHDKILIKVSYCQYKFVNKNPKTLKKQPYWWDSHPSTVGHARWLQECLLPVLQKETKFNDKQNKLNSDINNFYCKQEWELFDFREQLTQLMNLDLQETLHKVRGH